MNKNILKDKVSKENLSIMEGLNEVIELRNSNFEKVASEALTFQKDLDMVLYNSCLTDDEIENIEVDIDSVTFSLSCGQNEYDDYRSIYIVIEDIDLCNTSYITNDIKEYINREESFISMYALEILVNNKDKFANKIAKELLKKQLTNAN